MAKSNGSLERAPDIAQAITKLSVAGFKSILDEQTIEIRPLTLLAGANNSGKSSMMQPLLLLKQTLEAPYDPGPLLLNGPNVKLTSVGQFWPSSLSQSRSSHSVATIGTSNRVSFTVAFRRDSKGVAVELNSSSVIAL
jgi:predicted ATPase